ncbi:fibronectin type III domain-containing protein [Baekduia sp. Peel2402]|uniref:fibronectin type III domain-containing protein n=1 Tax=Baekduia sp. Peel2402 TaxID=3458296 RepID=UPI00403ED85A
MSYKFPAALAAGVAVLAIGAPVASAAVTQAPLTIAQAGDTVSFTIAAPGASPTPDRVIALFVAPADSGKTTFAATIAQGVGAGAATVGGSTADCQVVTGADAQSFDLLQPEYAEGTGFTWKVPASFLPASFDAKAVISDDPYGPDGCAPDAQHNGLAATLAGATRWPAPVVTPPVVTTPAPAPAPAPAPVVAPKPVADPDKDGIKNDWLVGGQPVAAPKAPKASGVTAHAATLTLPKAPKGGTIRVFVRVAGTGTFKAVTAKVDKKTGKATISGLKANKRYEVKVVAVNKAGQQTQASKAVAVKTKKK